MPILPSHVGIMPVTEKNLLLPALVLVLAKEVLLHPKLGS